MKFYISEIRTNKVIELEKPSIHSHHIFYTTFVELCNDHDSNE